ncbi:hypothetical protein V6N13_081145 [Hibiscus sabdariffa]
MERIVAYVCKTWRGEAYVHSQEIKQRRLTVKAAREENMKKAGERKHPINEQVRDHRWGEKEEISQQADGQT